MAQSKDYQKGYAAGRRYAERELARIGAQNRETQRERVYMRCLELALAHCTDWKIGDKRINNAEGYCKLAQIFADNSISRVRN